MTDTITNCPSNTSRLSSLGTSRSNRQTGRQAVWQLLENVTALLATANDYITVHCKFITNAQSWPLKIHPLNKELSGEVSQDEEEESADIDLQREMQIRIRC